MFQINDSMASLIAKGIGIRSYITSKAALGVLFLVLLSMPAVNLLRELILLIIVFVVIAFPHARHPYVNLGKYRPILDNVGFGPHFLLMSFLCTCFALRIVLFSCLNVVTRKVYRLA